MKAFSTILLCIFCTVAYGAKKSVVSALQMQKILQYVSGMDNELSCNLSTITPALLLSAKSINMETIMAELSQVAAIMYTKAHQECKSLQLSSTQCFQDCIPYNHPITLFQNTSSPSFYPSLISILELYSVSASPIGWYDVGNPDQCDYFGGKYCYTPLISQSINVPHGCCIPSSCTGSDAVKVVQNNEWCYKGFNTTYSQMFNQMDAQVQIFAVCDVPPRNTTSFGFIIVAFIASLFVFLVITASCYHQYIFQYKTIPIKDELNVNLNDEIEDIDSEKMVEYNTFLSIFSIQSIWNKFTSFRAVDKRAFNFLDGIRVYSMSWVILGHSYLYFFVSNGSNMMSLFPLFPGAPHSTEHTYFVNKWHSVFIQYAFYSVDTFFWLSGLLAAFTLYRNVKKMGGQSVIWYKWIPMAYLARYLRIVPMMMFATLIQWKISDQLPGGPHTMTRDVNNAACSDNWWKILLLQANLWLTKDNSDALSCMGHLWYLQVDWQCYLLLPWLVWIFLKKKRIGIICSLVPFIVCIIIRFYQGFYYHFGANMLLPPAAAHDGNMSNQSYFKPWPRMATYFIGVTLMFVMITINEWYNKHRNGRFVLYKWSYFVLMALSMFIFCSLVIWPYDDVKHAPEDRWGSTANQIYFALGRPSWGIALSLFAFATRYIDNRKQSKQKSVIKTILSFNIYQMIAKLTYTMYLIHLMVFEWWAKDVVIAPYYNGWFILLLFFGIWTLTAMITLVLYLFVEAPMNNMVTMCLKSVSKCCKRKGVPNDVNIQLDIMKGNDNRVQYNQFENDGNFSIVTAENNHNVE